MRFLFPLAAFLREAMRLLAGPPEGVRAHAATKDEECALSGDRDTGCASPAQLCRHTSAALAGSHHQR